MKGATDLRITVQVGFRSDLDFNGFCLNTILFGEYEVAKVFPMQYIVTFPSSLPHALLMINGIFVYVASPSVTTS